jgi:hypothetical protein
LQMPQQVQMLVSQAQVRMSRFFFKKTLRIIE